MINHSETQEAWADWRERQQGNVRTEEGGTGPRVQIMQGEESVGVVSVGELGFDILEAVFENLRVVEGYAPLERGCGVE